MQENEFISELINKVNKTNLSVFLGAGVSMDTGLPSWKALFKNVAREIGLDIDKTNDYYQLAQYCENRLGGDFRTTIGDSLKEFKTESKYTKTVVELPANSYWTTNFDEVLDNAIKAKYKTAPNIISKDEELIKARTKSTKTIYKMNGHFTEQGNWVLTKRDLENYSKNHEAMLTFFKRELVVNTFLFLGYSFTDTLVLSALRDVRRYFGDKDILYHYTILIDDESSEFSHFVKNLEKSYGIKVLTAKNGDNVIEVIGKLNSEIKNRRIYISGAFREELPNRSKAANIVKQLIPKLLEKGFNISTGMGRNLGEMVLGTTKNWLQENHENVDHRLEYHLYEDCDNDEVKKAKRAEFMENSGIVIFMFGQGDYGEEGSGGTKKEFEIAKERGLKIIPIGATGYQSKQIFEEVKSDISNYHYLQGVINDLNDNIDDVEKIKDAVMKAIDSA